jgi:hypothetical protein
MYIGGMDYACRTECFWWVIMGLGPCRVGLCSNIFSFIPIIYKNWSFLPHLILETKIAHHTVTSRTLMDWRVSHSHRLAASLPDSHQLASLSCWQEVNGLIIYPIYKAIGLGSQTNLKLDAGRLHYFSYAVALQRWLHLSGHWGDRHLNDLHWVVQCHWGATSHLDDQCHRGVYHLIRNGKYMLIIFQRLDRCGEKTIICICMKLYTKL